MPLDRIGWLGEQTPEFQQWAERVGRWQFFEAGQFVYHAGDSADGLYGLAAGSLAIEFPLVADEPVSIYLAEVGFWIGDAALLARRPRMVSVIAATDTRLLKLPGNAVHKLLDERPEFWHAFYRLSTRNVMMSVTLLSEALALTVRARICRRLLSLSSSTGAAEVTQANLARILGISRPTLRRCLEELVAQGAIEIKYGKVLVLNRTILESYFDEQ